MSAVREGHDRITTRSALLLAGGGSRRLGRDKPFVRIGGRTVLERLLVATASIDDMILSVREAEPFGVALAHGGWRRVVGRSRRSAPAPTSTWIDPGRSTRRVRVVPDPEPDLGPLAGLAAGLAAAGGEVTVVLAADLPFVTADLVEELAARLEESPGVEACVPVVDGRPQWLCAAYRARVAPLAATRLNDRSRARSVAMFANGLALRRLEEAELARFGDPRVFTRGIDTPEDLAWARGRARR